MPDTNTNEDLVNADNAVQIAWLVYINGLEVPVHSVNVSYGVWRIPEAQITMIPDPVLHRLGREDRVTVQVFYCDYWQTPGNPQFRLMFDGEIVGWSYVNVARQRALSFTCVDYVQIFTQMFFFFMSSVDDFATGASGDTIGVNINGVQLGGFGALYPYSLFAEGLVPNSPSDSEGGQEGRNTLIKRPIDFVYNIIRGMIQHNAPNRSIPAANFFAPWARRTKFHRRFVALPFLEDSDDPGVFPILRAVQAEYAMSAVARMTSEIGSAGSMWQMLQQIFQTLMVEMAMLPTPPAFEASYDKLQVVGPVVNKSEGLTPVFLGNYFVKPQMLFGIPPSCNVFFPSQIQHYNYEETYVTQPTRMYFNTEAWTAYVNGPNGTPESPGLSSIIRDALAVAHPEEVNQAARGAIDLQNPNGKNLLVYPTEFFQGPVVDRRPVPRWFMFLGNAQQSADGEAGGEASSSTDSDNSNVAPGDSGRDLYRLYAKYEFFKEKYSRRNGGLALAFNPYPVPGFPCATFDRRSTSVDTFGYLMTMQQSLTSKSWSSKAAFSYGRTMGEMFAELAKQFDVENEVVAQNRLDTVQRAQNGSDSNSTNTTTNQAAVVGAIGMAPPEPLVEVRSIIQQFEKAEKFYGTLLYRQIPDGAYADPASTAEIDRSSPSDPDCDPATESCVPDAQPISLDPIASRAATTQELAAQADLHGRKAAFHYSDIVDVIKAGDTTSRSIQIEGLSAQATRDIIEIINRMREGLATDDQVTFVRDALGLPNLEQQTPNISADPGIREGLNNALIVMGTMPVQHNLEDDLRVVPKSSASNLFGSYTAAMEHVARPIATLDEYIAFLGESGLKEGPVDPNVALAQGDARTFPAKYYRRIRRYRPGPPPDLPESDVTNTGTVSTTEGITTVDTAVASSSGDGTPEAQGIQDEFPETSRDWDALLELYRINSLVKLAPRT